MLLAAFRILILLIISTNVFSQTFSKQSTSYIPLKFLINAHGGGYWAIGDSANTIQLIRFDDSLSVIGSQLFSDSTDVTVTFLKQEANGHLLFGGNFTNAFEGFLVETDSSGNVLFTINPHNHQRIRSASISPQDELYVLISYDSAGYGMRFVSKFNPPRQLVWTYRSDHVLYSENPVACEFLNNLLYVFSNNPDGSDSKMRVESFNAAGLIQANTEWALNAPGVPDQQFIKTQSGKFIISGTGLPVFASFAPICNIVCMLSGQNLIRQNGYMFDNGTSFQQVSEFKSCVLTDGSIVTAGGMGDSMLIIKMDTLLNIQSAYIVEDNGSTISSIVNTTDDGFVLMLNNSGTSIFIKYDSLGQSLCGRTPYLGDSIVQIPSPTAAGSPMQNLSSILTDSFPLITTSSSYNLIDYCIPLTIKEGENNGYSIFPNPSAGKVKLLVPTNESYEILLLNVNGSIIIDDVSTGDYEINISDLPPAVYLVGIKSQSAIRWQRFVKQ
jgi:hypothetical protein